MANIIVAVFAIAMITGAVVLLTQASLSSASRVSMAWDGMVHRDGDRSRAELTLISADLVATSTNVDISIRNSGQTALRNFGSWDLVLQYYATTSNQGLNVLWMTYTTSTPPASGEWTVNGLFMSASSSQPEIYDPNIFNPGEEIIVRLNITPAIPTGTDNLATIGAAIGVTVAAPFSR